MIEKGNRLSFYETDDWAFRIERAAQMEQTLRSQWMRQVVRRAVEQAETDSLRAGRPLPELVSDKRTWKYT